MGKGGRRSKLTEETAEKIFNGIRLGLTYKDAAQLGGVSERTFLRWKSSSSRVTTFDAAWVFLKRIFKAFSTVDLPEPFGPTKQEESLKSIVSSSNERKF